MELLEQRDEHICLLDGQVEALATMLVEQDETVRQLQRRPRFLTDDDWNNLSQLADRVYDGFTSRLACRFPRLTAADRQIALLIRLRFTNVQMAQLLAVSPASVSQQRFRLKKRMMQTEEELFKEGETVEGVLEGVNSLTERRGDADGWIWKNRYKIRRTDELEMEILFLSL